ncbi:hypothetical protein [Azorhizobium sp. AG788]|uniref:hypothetical protein n=1 Tax=Azorhizobium sp. AG788 TaxID=2183897 RepID=UPI0031392047
MGRRPSPDHHALTVAVPRGHDGYWAIIRDLDTQGPWTPADVVDQSNADPGSIHDYVRRLAKAGICRQVAERPGVFKAKPIPVYQLCERPLQAPRLRRDGSRCPPTGQEQMWRALRNLGTVTYIELAHAASTDEVSVDPVAARAYLKVLGKAGYLVVAQASKPGKAAVWRLKPGMNTGPLPPLVMRTKFIWDQNRKAVMGAAEQAEEARP